MGWADSGKLCEYVDGFWGEDVRPDRWDVHRQVAKDRVTGLWAAGYLTVRQSRPGRRHFLLSEKGRTAYRLWTRAKRQGLVRASAADNSFGLTAKDRRRYPAMSEGRWFKGELQPEADGRRGEPASAVEPTAVGPGADVAIPASASGVSGEEGARRAGKPPSGEGSTGRGYWLDLGLQESQAARLGWSSAHADAVGWAAAGELFFDSDGMARRVTARSRGRGRRIAAGRVEVLVAAGFLTPGEAVGDGRGPVSLTADGRRALAVWRAHSPAPVARGRRKEREPLAPLLEGKESRRREIARREALRASRRRSKEFAAAWEVYAAARDRKEELDRQWRAENGILNPTRKRPAS